MLELLIAEKLALHAMVWRGALWTDIEQRAPFPVVGGGWITRSRKIPIIAGRFGRALDCPRATDRGSFAIESWPQGSTGAARQPSRRPRPNPVSSGVRIAPVSPRSSFELYLLSLGEDAPPGASRVALHVTVRL